MTATAGGRWPAIPVAEWQDTRDTLHLYTQVVGKSQAVTLDVTNMKDVIEGLRAKGVRIAVEPDVQPWGTNAAILDSEDNWILLVEQPKQ